MGGEVKRHQLVLDVPFVKDGFLFFLSFPDFLLGQSGAQNGSGVSNVFSSTGSSAVQGLSPGKKPESFPGISG